MKHTNRQNMHLLLTPTTLYLLALTALTIFMLANPLEAKAGALNSYDDNQRWQRDTQAPGSPAQQREYQQDRRIQQLEQQAQDRRWDELERSRPSTSDWSDYNNQYLNR